MISPLNDLSIVIPTLNAAVHLPRTLDTIVGSGAEIVIADGGSGDETLAVAARYGLPAVCSPPGRGRQLAAGAEKTSREWLLFLHADTRLQPDWPQAVAAFRNAHRDGEAAAAFKLRFDSPHRAARLLEWGVGWRCRLFALPYGDQGLLISRALYDRLGGYRPLPLMEDVDFVRRIGRRRLHILPAVALTSAERYERDGWTRRALGNLGLLQAYLRGADPHALYARYYRGPRQSSNGTTPHDARSRYQRSSRR